MDLAASLVVAGVLVVAVVPLAVAAVLLVEKASAAVAVAKVVARAAAKAEVLLEVEEKALATLGETLDTAREASTEMSTKPCKKMTATGLMNISVGTSTPITPRPGMDASWIRAM